MLLLLFSTFSIKVFKKQRLCFSEPAGGAGHHTHPTGEVFIQQPIGFLHVQPAGEQGSDCCQRIREEEEERGLTLTEYPELHPLMTKWVNRRSLIKNRHAVLLNIVSATNHF